MTVTVALRQSEEKSAEGGVDLVEEGFTHTTKVLVFFVFLYSRISDCYFAFVHLSHTSNFRLLFFSSHFGFKIFCCWGVLVVRNMVKNTFQSGFLSILYSFGYVLFFWSLFCLENKL